MCRGQFVITTVVLERMLGLDLGMKNLVGRYTEFWYQDNMDNGLLLSIQLIIMINQQ